MANQPVTLTGFDAKGNWTSRQTFDSYGECVNPSGAANRLDPINKPMELFAKDSKTVTATVTTEKGHPVYFYYRDADDKNTVWQVFTEQAHTEGQDVRNYR